MTRRRKLAASTTPLAPIPGSSNLISTQPVPTDYQRWLQSGPYCRASMAPVARAVMGELRKADERRTMADDLLDGVV
jgi:hypothetical protein